MSGRTFKAPKALDIKTKNQDLEKFYYLKRQQKKVGSNLVKF